jgi:hypothetical protein
MKSLSNRRVCKAPEKPSAFDRIESVEELFAQIMPPGATTLSWAEVEASLQLGTKLSDFEQRAKNLFKEIEAEIGFDRAQYIFRGAATTSKAPPSKRRIEESNNILLLSLYLEHRLPLQQFARRLANGNGYEERLGPFGLRYRKSTAEAIEQQLKRLLKKDPAKEKTSNYSPGVRQSRGGCLGGG